MFPLPSFKRCLLKLSGEIFSSDDADLSAKRMKAIATSLCQFIQEGKELAIVIGGGNFFRGVSLEEMGIQRTTGDAMGMLATLINGIALQEAIEKEGFSAEVLSALPCPSVVATFERRQALSFLKTSKIVILAGGTGHPFFTTDTAAALKACELDIDILLKGTKVDGIFDKDPLKEKGAVKFDTLTYEEVLAKRYGVMDLSAVALCMQNQIPLFVFNMSLLNRPINEWLGQKRYGTVVN